jgi:hypothetical protein
MAEIMVRTAYGLEELLHTGNRSQTIRKVNSLSVIEPETQAAPAQTPPAPAENAAPTAFKMPASMGSKEDYAARDAWIKDIKVKYPTAEIMTARSQPIASAIVTDETGNRKTVARFPEAQGVAESTELNSMLKYAGIPVAESRLMDAAGETLQHILNRFKHEVKNFDANGELGDDLYHALYDYYSDNGEIPYGVAKARDGDPYEWISDRLDQELGTGNYATRAVPEADAISTFEVMSGFDAPVAEGSCNMTAEGDFCPEHGLAECGGMYEMGTVAGGIAPVMGEGGQDPMDHRGAVTDSFYESTLARIKSLALLR